MKQERARRWQIQLASLKLRRRRKVLKAEQTNSSGMHRHGVAEAENIGGICHSESPGALRAEWQALERMDQRGFVSTIDLTELGNSSMTGNCARHSTPNKASRVGWLFRESRPCTCIRTDS